MKKERTISLPEADFPFLQDPVKKKKVLSEIRKLQRNILIITTPELPDAGDLKLRCFVFLAMMSMRRTDQPLLRLFRNINLRESFTEDEKNELLKKFIIPVRINRHNLTHTMAYDIMYGFYHCYLHHKETPEYFASQAGRTEMLMIDRFDFQNNFSDLLCMKPQSDSPIAMFASLNEYFFNHSAELQKHDREIFNALSALWNLNPFTFDPIRTAARKSGFEKKDQGKQKGLHWIYYYTLFSLFAGSFLLITLFNKTVMFLWMPLILAAAFSLCGILFKPVFRRKSIPYLKIPFLFFSMFGLGVNGVSLLLMLNMIHTSHDSRKVLIFPYSPEHIISRRIHPEMTNYEYDVKVQFKKGLTKRVTFKTEKGPVPKYFVLEMQKGLLGFYVIKRTSAQLW
jgi:hypothetical protein